MLFGLFEKYGKTKKAAALIYEKAVQQSRRAVFYQDTGAGVTDNLDGRFDVLSVHICLIVTRLMALPRAQGHALSQKLFDKMFREMDISLREAGVGDLSVPKTMNKLMKGFNGRIHRYKDGLAQGDVDALSRAIMRNVYRKDVETPTEHAIDFARYMLLCRDMLDGVTFDDLMAGRVEFPEPVFRGASAQAVA